MERSALYRRALAPIMIYCGSIGVAGGIIGWSLKINSVRGFVLFWSGVAAAALTGAFLLVRRQALKNAEPFWSPPTKRVTQAILPPLFIGTFIGLLWAAVFAQTNDSSEQIIPVTLWIVLYGCALHSAGFVISRGFRLFAWIFIIVGGLLPFGLASLFYSTNFPWDSPHLLMGSTFGGLHLAYGIYLYFTENRKTSP
jgi:hypothetical protein